MHFSDITPETLKQLREEYPSGTEVELVEMNDPYRDMPQGLKGKVICVDDAGVVHVAWENDSSLGVVYGVDRIRHVQ